LKLGARIEARDERLGVARIDRLEKAAMELNVLLRNTRSPSPFHPSLVTPQA
jgi:hypothetical protein